MFATRSLFFCMLVACILTPARGCIQCTPKGRSALNMFSLKLSEQLGDSIAQYDQIKRFGKTAEYKIIEYLEDVVEKLDQQAIDDIVDEYKKSVDVIDEIGLKEVQLLHIIGMHFQRLDERVRAIVQEANERKCPNKIGENSCGLLMQSYIHCDTCDVEKVICAAGPPKVQEFFDWCPCICNNEKCVDLKTGKKCKPCREEPMYRKMVVDCGEKDINIPAGENLYLDCSLDWQLKLKQPHKTLFTKDHEMKPILTDDLYLKRYGVRPLHSGRYECATVLKSGIPVSSFRFKVKVIGDLPEPVTERIYVRLTIPPVWEKLANKMRYKIAVDNTTLKAIYIGGGVGIIIIIAICTFICLWRRRKREKIEEREPV